MRSAILIFDDDEDDDDDDDDEKGEDDITTTRLLERAAIMCNHRNCFVARFSHRKARVCYIKHMNVI